MSSFVLFKFDDRFEMYCFDFLVEFKVTPPGLFINNFTNIDCLFNFTLFFAGVLNYFYNLADIFLKRVVVHFACFTVYKVIKVVIFYSNQSITVC